MWRFLMPRYAPKPKSWWDEDGDFWPDPDGRIDVIVEDDLPRPTGVLDKHGNELFEIPLKRRIGF